MSSDLSQQIVKAVFLCDQSYKADFKKSNCCLTISVGQLPHEAAKLLATLDLVNKSFQECIINVCDSLQRHTLAVEDNLPMEEADSLSKRLGDEWLERNLNLYNRLEIPYKIVRWDYWLNHPKYAESAEKIDDLYQNNAFFRKHIQIAANLYIERCKKRCAKDDNFYALLYSASMQYLKEECAVMLICAEAGYNFELYPSERNIAMTATFEILIQPNNSHVLKPLALKFKKRATKQYCSTA